MLTRSLATLILLLAFAGIGSARQPAPVQEPTGKPAAQAAPRQNVRLELTIVDETGTAEPVRKTVSMILADRSSGMVRSSGNTVVGNSRVSVVLNVDASPRVLDDKRVHVEVSLEYAPKPTADGAANGDRPMHLSERLALIVTSGKPMVVSQASDPVSDRRMMVELKATILE